MKIRWSPAATALARRYLRDQDGMRAIGVAVAALAAATATGDRTPEIRGALARWCGTAGQVVSPHPSV